jgi:hypothetical protein
MLTCDYINMVFTQIVFNRFYCSAKPKCRSAFGLTIRGCIYKAFTRASQVIHVTLS